MGFPVFLVEAALILCPWSARAADDDDQIKHNIQIKSRHIFDSDVKAMSGEIDIIETELKYDLDFKIEGELPVTLSLDFNHIDLNENIPVNLPSHLEGRSFWFSTKFPMPFMDSEHYFMGVDIIPTLNTDSWKWRSGAFRLPFRIYGIYKESDSFILVAGVSVCPEYDTVVLPLLGLIYKPNDRLSFNLASSDPNISYKLTETTTLLWEFDYTLEEYEVTRSGTKGVVLKYREYSTGVGLQYKPCDYFRVVVSVGGVFNRRLDYRDGAGKVDPDAGLYTGGQINIKF